MAIRVECECGKRIQVDESAAGKRIKCRGCGARLEVPQSQKASDRPKAKAARSGRSASRGESNRPVTIAVVASVLIFAGVAFVLVRGKLARDASRPSPLAAASTAEAATDPQDEQPDAGAAAEEAVEDAGAAAGEDPANMPAEDPAVAADDAGAVPEEPVEDPAATPEAEMPAEEAAVEEPPPPDEAAPPADDPALADPADPDARSTPKSSRLRSSKSKRPISSKLIKKKPASP